jgi:leucyl aminopeptidase
MSIKINYKNNILKKSSKNLILFVGEGFDISSLKKYLSNIEFSYINDLLKNSNLKKDILFFEINSQKKIFLVSIKKNLKNSEIENLGAKFHGYVNYDKNNDYSINSDTINDKKENAPKLKIYINSIPEIKIVANQVTINNIV